MAVPSRREHLDGSNGVAIGPETANLMKLATLGVAALLIGQTGGLNAGPAWAQSASAPANRDAGTLSHDCTEVTVDYSDEPGLTREERIARMDRAFQRSLSRFEECQSERAGTGAGTGGGTGGGEGGASGSGSAGSGASESAGSESDGAETSTAASDIFGPDAPVEAPPQEGPSKAASDVTGDEPAVTASTTPGTTRPSVNPDAKWTRPDDLESDTTQEESPATDEPVREAARTQGGGKVPEDIPPADNDSALEAQIRQAAIEETDPELKKRLWDEYRRYKGLPVAK
jgi:hypothetical protein